MDHTTWEYTTHVNKSLVRYYIISPYTTSYHLTMCCTMLNILVWLLMILDILILADNRLRHTTLYLMVYDCILSYRACTWLSITLSLHITSNQNVYCTMPAYLMLYWSITCSIMGSAIWYFTILYLCKA